MRSLLCLQPQDGAAGGNWHPVGAQWVTACGGLGVCKQVSCGSLNPCGALCVCTFRCVGVTGPRGGGSWGVECLPLGSRGQGRCQAWAAGCPAGGSRRSTHTGGPDPRGPGTGSSRGCPRRSCRPPLRETWSRPSSAGSCFLRVRAQEALSTFSNPQPHPRGLLIISTVQPQPR